MNILSALTGIYMLLIFIRIMLTWFSGANYGRPMEILTGITDPYLDWFRRFPALRAGFLDLSPIVAMAVLSLVNQIFSTLAQYGAISLGIILAMVLSALWSAISFILGFFLIILGLRLIAYLTNQDVYNSVFWKIVDTISQPVLYRIKRILFRRRLVNYLTGIITSMVAVLVLMMVLGTIVKLAIAFLAALPL
ncbi:MAG: YggT family protein [Treponema sp.]|nr:YggT family protein [Treponema sp.]